MSRSRTERLLLTDGFADWCAAHPGARVALYAGAEHMHTLLVPEDLPLADDAELLRYARLQFTHYFGSAAAAWPLATWTRGACALAGFDLAALQVTAAAHRVRIVSLRPTWTLAPAREGDTAVLDTHMLTWLKREGGRLVDLQQRHVDDELPAVQAVQACDLLVSSKGQPGPDFIAQPSPLRPLLWAWAAAAAAACVTVAVQADGQQEEAQRLAEQAAVLDRLARPAPARAAAPNPAARARAWVAARQLENDWSAAWSALERALPPGLQLSALDLDGKTLRLEGQANSADAVTQLVDRLALQAGSNEEVALTRLQRPDAPADVGPLRFELVRRTVSSR